MSQSLSDTEQVVLTLATLFAALAKTLGEQDETFVLRFDEHIEKLYRELKDYQSEPLIALAGLRETSKLLKAS
jgi:hypothetical protein